MKFCRISFMVMIAVVFLSSGARKQIPVSASNSVERAFSHLNEIMDKYHQTFYIYTDEGAGGNHFVPSGWMGDWLDLSFSGNWYDNPRSGNSCIKTTYSAKGTQGNQWAGIYWQYPENNWGEKPGNDLTGATKLTFWARGEKGSEKAEFKVGGINRSPFNDQQKPYQDSCDALSTGIVLLTDEWREYSIDLIKPDSFAVYTSRNAGSNNHYFPSGWYNGVVI